MFVQKITSNKLFLVFIPLLISSIFIFHRLGEQNLGGDDAYYSAVAQEMVSSGDWLTTRINGEIDFSTGKPPLLMWMNAISGSIFGFSNLSMRLPSAILGFLSLIVLLFFVKRYFDSLTAFFSVLVLAFTQQYQYHMRSSVTDGPFAVFFTFAMLCFWIAQKENKNIFYYLSGISVGLAIMTKQLSGLFIIFAILSYIVIARRWSILKNPHFYGMFLSSAIVALPWHLIMYKLHGMLFIKGYFRTTLLNAVKGYAPDWSLNPSINPWYAYFQILINNYWPWLPFLIIGLIGRIKNLRKYFDDPTYDLELFILIWAFVPIILFQIVKVKQFHYINPMYVPFAIIVAQVFSNFKNREKAAIWLSSILLFVGCVFIAYPIIPKYQDSREFVETIKLVPTVKSIKPDILTLRKGYYHFRDGLAFYAQKKVVKLSQDRLIEAFNGQEHVFVLLFKDAFNTLDGRIEKDRIKILFETKDSILFTNK